MIAYVTIACGVVYWFMPYSGDDLAYLGAFHGLNGCATGYYDAVFDFSPRWVVRHWVYVNGRFANNLYTFVALWFPHMVNALIVSVSIGAMLWVTLKLSGFGTRDVAGKMLLISIIAFALPWWDSFMVYDVVYNYVVGAVAVLGMTGVFLYRRVWLSQSSRPMLALWCCLSFLAGGMHEAASVPVLVAMLFYLWLTNGFSQFDNNVKLTGWCFVAGAAWCFFSPGIWARLGSGYEPDDELWLLLLKSDMIPMLLYAFIMVSVLTRKGRNRLSMMLKSPWAVFVIASFGSFLFSAVSGVVGRSGWFATLYALVALFMWGNMNKWRLGPVTGAVMALVLAVLVAIHYFEFAKWQIRVGSETRELERLYAGSESGAVYIDATRDTEVPVWVLGKTRGIPDADDYYQMICFDGYFGGGNKRLVVLPLEVKEVLPGAIGERGVHLGNGDMLTCAVPEGAYYHSNTKEPGGVMLWRNEEEEYVVTPFTHYGEMLYHISPRIADPGDR